MNFNINRDKGWVSIYRSLQEHPLWQEKPFSKGQAWIDLILLANHNATSIAHKGSTVLCARGTVNRSIKSLAERWGWSRGKVRRFLQRLQEDGMVIADIAQERTVITIVNYARYQCIYPADPF